MIYSISIINRLSRPPYAFPGSHHSESKINQITKQPKKVAFMQWGCIIAMVRSISVNCEYVNGTTVTSQSIDWERLLDNIDVWRLRLNIQNKSVIVCNHWGFL